MSILTKLHIEENILNILHYRLSVIQNVDYIGRPSSKPVVQPIEFTYESIKNDPFYEKMLNGKMTNSMKFIIAPAQMNSKTTKIELIDFYVLEQHEHFDGGNSKPMTSYVKISFASIVVNDVVMDVKYWKKNDPHISKVAPTVIFEEEEKEVQIRKITWLHADTKEQIKEAEYDKKIALRVEVKNAKGGTADIVIKKEDGTAFKSGMSELSFIAPVSEEGIAEIEPFLIERVWEDNKVQLYDYLVASVQYENKTKESKEIKIIPFPQIVVDFRPKNKYKGDYGFDYLRDKETKKDRVTYKKILGTNNDSSGTNVFTKYPTDTKYNSIKDNEYTPLVLDWYKDFEGNPLEYPQSYLTIYPNTSVTLSLQIETIENPKEITFDYDTNLFSLNTETIAAQSKGSKKRLKDALILTCKSEFSEDKIIKVMYKDRLLGQLNILKNAQAHRKKAKVVFVQVGTDIKNSGRPILGKFTTSNKSEKNRLEQLLKQAYIKLELEEFLAFNPSAIIDPSTNRLKYPNFNTDYTLIDIRPSMNGKKILHKYKNNTRENINIFMEKAFDEAHPQFTDYHKVFFFGDSCGRADNVKQIQLLGGFAKRINSKSVSVFSGRASTDVSHELLHAMGLYHSFKNNNYCFKKGATKNIMDYATNKNHTWRWQWKKLWSNPNLLNE